MAAIPTKPAVGDPIRKSWADAVVDALGDHETRLGAMEGAALPNGSFETDDGAGAALGWSYTTTGGGAVALTSSAWHGRQAIRLSALSVGDQVELTSDAYIPTAPGEAVEVECGLIASAAGVSVTAELLWYYWTGSAWAAATTPSSTVYSSTSNPTAWTRLAGRAGAPGGTNPAQAYRVRFTVAEAGGVTGTVTLDGVRAGRRVGYVPLTPSQVASAPGTVSLASILGDMKARAALLRYNFLGDSFGNPLTFTLTGNGHTALTVDTSDTTNTRQGQAVVELNDSGEFTVSASGGTPQACDVYLLGVWL